MEPEQPQRAQRKTNIFTTKEHEKKLKDTKESKKTLQFLSNRFSVLSVIIVFVEAKIRVHWREFVAQGTLTMPTKMYSFSRNCPRAECRLLSAECCKGATP
jgi:hypothetical protein